jgi:hypothetical protein
MRILGALTKAARNGLRSTTPLVFALSDIDRLSSKKAEVLQ